MSGGDASPRDRAARVGFPWVAHFRRRPRPSTAEACEAIEARARVLEHVRNIAVPSVANGDPAPLLLRTHPGNITQVVMQPERCALSVQIRHWRHETIGPVTVKETDDTVEIQVSVGTPADAAHGDYFSFGVTFSWISLGLDRPLDAREVVHSDLTGTHRPRRVASGTHPKVDVLVRELGELVDVHAMAEMLEPTSRLAQVAGITDVTADAATDAASEPPIGPPPIEVICGADNSNMGGDHWEHWGAAEAGARIVLTRPQKFTLGMLLLVPPAFLVLRPRAALVAWVVVVTAMYVGTGGYKIALLIRGERASARFTPPAPAEGEDLPIYSVLVPLYREGRILPVLVKHLEELDYPTDRLQVLLLIEADDEETQHAARQYSMPPHVRSVIMPPGQPRTKPRALNVGLHVAQGEYIVIYDAEDRPESDQLRKAVAAFRHLPAEVACLQARLNFYNRNQSLLARLFAVDYATWYDQFLPGLTDAGLARPGAFIPLGGTSNHFRVDGLKELGGWDPYNVTEDCDLGARLGRAGLRVGLLDSVTWEEAVPHVKPWIKQRSRWVKGYIQTYLVHMRRPLKLLRQLGPRGFIDFQMLVGGSSLILLLNPLMWALTATYVTTGARTGHFIESLFPTWLYYPSVMSFVVGNFVLFYSYAYVSVRRNYIELTRYALLAPLYWILMSAGAWVGLVSLIRNPFYWAKTEHGVSLSDPSLAPAVTRTRVEQTPNGPTRGTTFPEVEDAIA